MKLYTAIIAVTFGLVGCISEYYPESKSGLGDYMVVEGTITDGQTVVSLHWSTNLNIGPLLPGVQLTPRPESGALIRVESEAGASFPSTEEFEEVEITDPWGNVGIERRITGRYIIETGTLDDNTRYRLRIEANGEEFVSQWRAPQSTPPVEELTIVRNGDLNQVLVDVTGEEDGTGNYLWSYEETWQIKAAFNATHYFGLYEGDYLDRIYSLREYRANAALKVYSYPRVSPYFNCWKYGASRELMIASTEKLSNNLLRDHVLFEFNKTNDRLSVLYHIKLKQFAIADDAYEYYNTLKENTDNTGSIFAPIPSEMQGNLVCTTSPENYVIGFVEVSHAVIHEMLMPRVTSPYEPPATTCRQYYLTDEDLDKKRIITIYNDNGFTLASDFTSDPGSDVNYDFASFATYECLDCRALGGVKRRPSWWPSPDQ